MSAETLAAYVDGRLSAPERAAIETHAVTCDDCRDAMVDVAAIAAEFEEEDTPVQPVSAAPPSARPARWIWYVGAGVAAVITLAVGVPVWRSPSRQVNRAMTDLVSAVGASRFTQARLSEPFAFGQEPSPLRGRAEKLPTNVERAALELEAIADGKRTADTLRGAGIGHLVRGDVDAAVDAFTEAATLAPSDTAVHTDLAAALLERWRRNRSASDARLALNHAELARTPTAATPAALFNYALALEALNLRDAAIKAWQEAHDSDPDSSWAQEANAHLARLRQQGMVSGPALSDATTDADLATLARDRPEVLYARLDDLLGAWARGSPTETTTLPPQAEAIGRALRTADRDVMRSDLVDAVQHSPRLSAHDRACLRSAVGAIPRSRAAFTRNDYPGSRTIAFEGATDARCAGVPDLPFLALAAYAGYFDTTAPGHAVVVNDGRAIAAQLEARHYWFSLGRMHYIDGLWADFDARSSDALLAFERAATYAGRSGDPDLVATTLVMTATAYRTAGAFDQAWAHNVESFSHLPAISIRARHIALAGGLQTALRADDSGAALALGQLLLANDAEWNAGLVSAWYQQAEVLHALGRTPEALNALDQSRRALAAGGNADFERSQAEILARDGTVRLEIDPAGAVASFAGAIDKLTALDLPTRLPALRLQRARAERALGRREDAIADLRKGVSIFEDQRATLRSDQLRTSRFDQAWQLYSDLIDLERADPRASLDLAERARARALLDSLSRTQQLMPLSGHELYSWMPEGQTALVYAALADRLLIWSVTREGVVLTERSISAERLKTMVTAFVNDTRAGRRPANGHDLAAVVLPDRLPSGPDRRLAFLPDGPLYLLPFGLLPSGSNGAPLVSDTVTTIAPSLTILSRLTQAPSPGVAAPRRALLVGYGQARPAEGLESLPDVDAEISDIARFYPDRELLIGQAASPHRILAALGDASIVHFAGHAVADEVFPSQSRLLVAPDDTGLDAIRPEAIAASHLRPDAIVVLSACDTARGRIVHGEGAMSLSRPFLAAGASAVVASLWPVRDEDSRLVLGAWHRLVAHGATPAQALAETQREFLNRGSTAAFAFEVIGTDRPNPQAR